MTSKRLLLACLVIVLVYAAGLAALSQVRAIDGDEGYYAMAARLVSEGRAPYVDFFFPQMPYLPYVYAPVFRVVGSSLLGLRLFSVAISVLALVVWGLLLQARFGGRPMHVIGGLLLVAVNPYLLSWDVTVKTYALTNFGVFCTLYCADRGLRTRQIPWLLLAGLAAGLTTGVRLLYLPWAVSLPAALFWLRWRRPQAGLTSASVAMAAVGLVLGLVPALRFYLADPERFRFNNLDYHNLRFSPLDRAADTPQALAAVLELLRTVFLNPFMLGLVALAVFGWLAVRRSPAAADRDLRPIALVAGLGAVVHTIACLLPDPVHAQYFTSPLAPMLSLLAVIGMADLARRFGRPAPVIATVVVLAAALGAVDLQVRHTGMDPDPAWAPAELAAVSAAIEARTGPDDLVLAFWSGYVFETGRRPVPGLENHFALGVSEKLPLDRKIAYRIAGKEVLLKAILSKAPTVVVLGGWMHELNTTIDQQDLPLLLQELENNYQPDWTRGQVQVLVRKPGPGVRF